MLRAAANHAEEHFDHHFEDKTVNFKININSEKLHMFNEKIDDISSGKDKLPNISSITSERESQQGRACVARFPL